MNWHGKIDVSAAVALRQVSEEMSMDGRMNQCAGNVTAMCVCVCARESETD